MLCLNGDGFHDQVQTVIKPFVPHSQLMPGRDHVSVMGTCLQVRLNPMATCPALMGRLCVGQVRVEWRASRPGTRFHIIVEGWNVATQLLNLSGE